MAVTGLTIIQNNDSSVNISWNAIASNDILFYMIYYNTTINGIYIYINIVIIIIPRPRIACGRDTVVVVLVS